MARVRLFFAILTVLVRGCMNAVGAKAEAEARRVARDRNFMLRRRSGGE